MDDGGADRVDVLRALGAVTAPLRTRVISVVQRSLGSPQDGLDTYRSPAGDPGLFGPDSVAWVVHGDLPVMLVGGLSALMLQTLHPLAMAGVAQHSRYREDPDGRLQRTARFIAGTTFGPTEFAERLIVQVRAVHDRVHGVAPDGRWYSAHDPDLLTFVHVCEVWSFLRSHQRYSRHPLLMAEKDRYLAETAQIARRLGALEVPSSVAEVRAYLRAVRPSLQVTAEALEAVRFLRRPRTSSPGERLAHRIVTDAAVDLMPRFAREMLELRTVPLVSPAAARSGAATMALALRWAMGPSPVVAASTARVAGHCEVPAVGTIEC